MKVPRRQMRRVRWASRRDWLLEDGNEHRVVISSIAAIAAFIIAATWSLMLGTSISLPFRIGFALVLTAIWSALAATMAIIVWTEK